MGYRQIYAVYRNDENIADGTAEQLAVRLGVKPKTIVKWASPSQRKKLNRRFVVVRLAREEIENE